MPDPFVTYAPRNSDNLCYRHPDRQSFVLCQRCGRTICPQCQTPAAVGVHCPECVREARGSMPRVRTRPQVVTRMNSLATSGGPIVSYALIGLLLIGFIAGLVPGVANELAFFEPLTILQPWRLFTGMFVYAGFGSIIQLLFNGYMLVLFGGMIERQLGSVRYAGLYLLGGLGGEVAVGLFSPGTALVGGSVAVFGLFGAFYMIQRHLGQRAVQILVIVALNIVIGLYLHTPWQAYIGAVLIGGLTAYIYMKLQNRQQQVQRTVLATGLAVVLIAVALVRSAQLLGML
ncbi:hypothetical protein AX769_04260 [Frondihabitans sp. PAMC 28766]|nr:hypothetical protein AX769_04260 [Frondihabitans sp. PAMC 28766]